MSFLLSVEGEEGRSLLKGERLSSFLVKYAASSSPQTDELVEGRKGEGFARHTKREA